VLGLSVWWVVRVVSSEAGTTASRRRLAGCATRCSAQESRDALDALRLDCKVNPEEAPAHLPPVDVESLEALIGAWFFWG